MCNCNRSTVNYGVCVSSANRHANHSATRVHARQTLEIAHSNVWRPNETATLSGANKFLLLLDEFSRMVFLYTCCIGNRMSSINLWNFNDLSRTKLANQNGTKYVNLCMRNIMKRRGIVHQTSTPHTPQQNGISERMKCEQNAG